MRPGQTAPECRAPDLLFLDRFLASMRPGQTAPECPSETLRGSFCPGGFNEAGADCPGMRRRPDHHAVRYRVASMRPGQTAPECDGGQIITRFDIEWLQ